MYENQNGSLSWAVYFTLLSHLFYKYMFKISSILSSNENSFPCRNNSIKVNSHQLKIVNDSKRLATFVKFNKLLLTKFDSESHELTIVKARCRQIVLF